MNWPSLLKWLAAYEDGNAFAYSATKSSSEGEKVSAGAFDIVDDMDGVDWEVVEKSDGLKRLRQNVHACAYLQFGFLF